MTWRYYDMTPKLFPNSWRSLSPSSVSWEQAGDQPEKFALKLRSFAYNVRVLANIETLEVQHSSTGGGGGLDTLIT